MEVTVKINADTPKGRKLIRELENNKDVEVIYPMPEHIANAKKYTAEEVFEPLMERINQYYGSNYKLKYK